jgi:hypothetical protein
MIPPRGKAVCSMAACVAMAFGGNCARADALPKGWQSHNMEPIAHVKVDGPRAFKLSIARRDERWFRCH